MTEKNTAPQSVLRVLSGAQKGARLELKATRYTIGSGESCAIVLTGVGVAKLHAEAFFADGQLSLTRLHDKAYLGRARAPIDTLPADIASGEILILGKTAIAYGPEDAAWPDAAAITDALHESDAEHKDAEDAPAPEEVKEPEVPEEIETPSPTWQKRAAQFLFFAAFAGSFTLLGIGFIGDKAFMRFIAMTGLVAPAQMQAPVPPPPSPFEMFAADIARDPAFTHIHIKEDSMEVSQNATAYLTGYTQQTADLNRLRARTTGINTRIQAVSLENMRQSLGVLLSLYGPHVSSVIGPKPDGMIDVFIEGVVRHEKDLLELKKTLRADLPNIVQITTSLITEEDAARAVRTYLERYPQFSKLNIRTTPTGVRVSGILLDNFRDDWGAALNHFKTMLPGGIVPVFSVRFGPLFRARLESTLIGPTTRRARLIYGNPPRTFSYHEGHPLPDGLMLKKINSEGLILSDGRDDYFFPITNRAPLIPRISQASVPSVPKP